MFYKRLIIDFVSRKPDWFAWWRFNFINLYTVNYLNSLNQRVFKFLMLKEGIAG